MSGKSSTEFGRVYLVGAGPGAAGLITLRGVECLQRADVVLYDYLVNPQILQHARPDAQRICLGRHGHSRIWTQEEISAQTVAFAVEGRTVVRLKGGDPAVFARGSAEIEALVEQGIPFEIVPGITTALAAGSYTGVPLTHRRWSSAVALVTGQETRAKTEPGIDYRKLAQFPGTLVIYMGATTAEYWTEELMAGGMSPDTPALIIRRCSFPNQLTVSCTLGEVSGHFSGRQKLRPPVVVVIGEVAGLPRPGNWFERLPLIGQTVLVTRPAGQSASLRSQLQELGAEVLLQPAIEVREPNDWSAADKALARLEAYDWVVFSSVNGVRALANRLFASGRDVRALGSVRLAAIGPATAEALEDYHLRADRCPQRYQAEDLAESLVAEASGARFLLVRASRGREVLAERLSEAGAAVDQAVFYDSVDVEAADDEIVTAMRRGRIGWTTVTSSAIARSLANLFAADLAQTRLVSISPITSATLRELGYEPAAEAHEATMDGVVDAMLQGVARE